MTIIEMNTTQQAAERVPNSHQPDPDGRQPLVTVPGRIRVSLPAPGAKPRREMLRPQSLKLPALRAVRTREIAATPNCTEQRPVVLDHLGPMVKEGVLAYTIPEMESHPDQRYAVPSEKPMP